MTFPHPLTLTFNHCHCQKNKRRRYLILSSETLNKYFCIMGRNPTYLTPTLEKFFTKKVVGKCYTENFIMKFDYNFLGFLTLLCLVRN